MNRKQRRRALKGSQPAARSGFRQPKHDSAPVIKKFDETTMFRLKYDLSVPGGELRVDTPSRYSGVIEAQTEADALRGIVVKLLDSYGYTPHDRAVSGLLGEVFNPLPRRLRGAIAYALIEGLGLAIITDDEEVCDDKNCGAVKERSIHPDPPEDTPEEDLPLLIDTTSHAPECHVNREVDPEHPERPLRPATYKQEPVTSIYNPRHYEPLNQSTPVPETDGELSTVDADESFVVEEDSDAGTQDAGAPESASTDAE